MASRQSRHDLACRKSDFVITSFRNLPATRQKKAMFTSTPPSVLPATDRLAYGRQYNKLVTALNAPASTSRGKKGDYASHARKALWELWEKGRSLRQAQPTNDQDDEDEDEEDEDSNGGSESETDSEHEAESQPRTAHVGPKRWRNNRDDLPIGWFEHVDSELAVVLENNRLQEWARAGRKG